MLTDYFHVQLRQSIDVLLPLESTTEVISCTRGEICQIPGVESALLGVVNQRGKLLWVLDLSDLLKLPPSPTRSRFQDNLTLVVLSDRSLNSTAREAEHQVGCVVAALKGIVPLNASEFKPAPASFSSSLKSISSNIVEIEDSFITVLNAKAVLAAIQTSVNTISLAHNL